MGRLRLAICVATLLSAPLLLAQTRAPAAVPRLVVMVVLDGFRADGLTTFASHWRRGMKTLLAEGLLYLQGETGTVALAEATPTAYKEISRLDRKSTRLNSSH